MMNAESKTVVNGKGKRIKVDAKGWAWCENCTCECNPDDMVNDYHCVDCNNDLHSDDWTMDDI
jgi:hypothetical protein